MSILNKIEEFVNSNKIFSAFEVTKALRKDGIIVQHWEVKKEISQFDFVGVDYVRRVAKYSDFAQKPFVYYPIELTDIEVDTYEKAFLTTTKVAVKDVNIVTKPPVSTITIKATIPDPTPVVPTVTPVVSTASDIDPVESIYLNSDVRGRFAIPNRIIKTFFKVGDFLGIWLDKDIDTTVIELVSDNWDYDTILKVDKSGNIRIPGSYLPGNGQDELNFDFDLDLKQILVTKVNDD